MQNPGRFIVVSPEMIGELVDLVAKGRRPSTYDQVRWAHECLAGPFGHAAVDLDSQIQARWIDGWEPAGGPCFGIRLTKNPDLYFALLTPRGFVGICIEPNLPRFVGHRMRRFLPSNMVLDEAGITDADGQTVRFLGGWLVLSAEGSVVASASDMLGVAHGNWR